MRNSLRKCLTGPFEMAFRGEALEEGCRGQIFEAKFSRGLGTTADPYQGIALAMPTRPRPTPPLQGPVCEAARIYIIGICAWPDIRLSGPRGRKLCQLTSSCPKWGNPFSRGPLPSG